MKFRAAEMINSFQASFQHVTPALSLRGIPERNALVSMAESHGLARQNYGGLARGAPHPVRAFQPGTVNGEPVNPGLIFIDRNSRRGE
ncbi:MAG TPA: hypothetical protein VMW89_05830 [Desulfatiglandales bacterium]|nr:hypothetical protein [Desulfatiglandales bacterium]